MKLGTYLALLFIAVGVLLFIAGSSVIGRYVYSIKLMFTLTAVGFAFAVAGFGMLVLQLLLKKRNVARSR